MKSNTSKLSDLDGIINVLFFFSIPVLVFLPIAWGHYSFDAFMSILLISLLFIMPTWYGFFKYVLPKMPD